MNRLLTLACICLVTIVRGQTVIHEVGIAQSNDDVEQEGDFVDLNDLELDLGWNLGEESKVGLFFRDVHLDTFGVDSAFIRLTLQTDLTDTLEVYIQLESQAFPNEYTDTMIDAGRSYFSTSIEWVIAPDTAGTDLFTPNLASLIASAFTLQDWGPSSGLNFLLRPKDLQNNTVHIEAEFFSYDQNQPSRRPRLFVETDQGNINGLHSYPASNGLVVFPNPSHGQVEIKSEAMISRYVLRDVQGRSIQDQSKLHSTQFSLWIEHPGFYTLEVMGENGVEVERLIVR
ncbi:MAG: T9SS type A sorting domain-containing protein [Cryomorphaceae bacterium]